MFSPIAADFYFETISIPRERIMQHLESKWITIRFELCHEVSVNERNPTTHPSHRITTGHFTPLQFLYLLHPCTGHKYVLCIIVSSYLHTRHARCTYRILFFERTNPRIGGKGSLIAAWALHIVHTHGRIMLERRSSCLCWLVGRAAKNYYQTTKCNLQLRLS